MRIKNAVMAIVSATVLGGNAFDAMAAEIGFDASVGVEHAASGRVRLTHLAIPGAPGIDGGLFQTFRVAFPIGETNAIEVTPGMSAISYSYDLPGGGQQTSTERQFAVGLALIHGRFEGTGAKPYVRAGVQLRASDYSYSEGSSQFGGTLGAGIRWRLGKVLGLRSELSVARWIKGDVPSGWDAHWNIGVSAFTK
jgi:hypothetical protein